MKTIKLFIISMFLLLTFTSINAQSIEVKPDYYDAYVDQTGKVEPALDMLLISNINPPAINLNSVVMNFKLPAIPSGTSLLSASFTSTTIRKDQWVSFNGDLYGIDFRALDVAVAGDYYSGAFTAGPNVGNGNDWGIMDNFVASTDPYGNSVNTTKTTDATANAQLVSFLKQQYGNGAVNKYAFLRLSMDNLTPATNWQRYAIASSADVTYYPRLTLVFGVANKIEEVSIDFCNLRATADRKIVVEMNEPLMNAKLMVYSLTGGSVLNENIVSKSFIATSVLKSGAYVVKIYNNGKTISRSIIVK